MTKEEVITLLQQKIPYLAAEYGVKRIGLFGSYGKSVSTEQSDVDLIIEFDRPIGFKFIELTDYLEELLGKNVDVLTPDGIEDIRIERIATSIKDSVVYV